MAVRREGRLPPGLAARLEQARATVVRPGGGVLLAAWAEMPGQGVWQGPGGAVAYDLDLMSWGVENGESPHDPGERLWRLYRDHGEGFVDGLRGAFGFAVWDGAEQKLFVATDPYGIRPVVHAATSNGCIAGSRVRHVLLHPEVGADLDLQAVYLYLFFSAVPTPHTIYRSIRKLAPGGFLRHRDNRTTVGLHYDIRYRPRWDEGEGYWRRAIPMEVRRAVGRTARLSDPTRSGCFLSGGTDSSSVAGFYGEATGTPAATFSIGFDEPGYNELDFAHHAVDRFGTRQHESYVTADDVLALVEALPHLYDEPFGNSSVVPAYYCARMAREAGVDVLLAGDGGDEVFGGNERYVANLVFEAYSKIPGFLRRGLVEPLLGALPAAGPLYKARRYVRRANIPNPERFYSYNLLAERDPATLFQPDFLAQISTDAFVDLAREHYARAAPAHDTDRLLYLDMKFVITDNDLRKVTQMGEAAGVRVRYPLLDRDLVDFTATIPPTLKVKPGRNRYIFKRAMEGFLPDEIIKKSKHGFGLPIGPWFEKHPGLSGLLRDALFSGTPRVTQWVRPEYIRELKRGFEAGEVSYYGANLWILLMLELWVRGREA